MAHGGNAVESKRDGKRESCAADILVIELVSGTTHVNRKCISRNLCDAYMYIRLWHIIIIIGF